MCPVSFELISWKVVIIIAFIYFMPAKDKCNGFTKFWGEKKKDYCLNTVVWVCKWSEVQNAIFTYPKPINTFLTNTGVKILLYKS
jgi:hypothetical protein